MAWRGSGVTRKSPRAVETGRHRLTPVSTTPQVSTDSTILGGAIISVRQF